MSVVGAIVLLFGGLLGLVATWRAAGPIGDPTRRYSPWWLPSMVVSELAPLWLGVTVATFAVGAALGGLGNPAGVAGATALAVAAVLLVLLTVRAHRAARRLRPLIVGPVRRRRRALFRVRHIPTPPGVEEVRRVDYAPGVTLDLVRPEVVPLTAPVLVYVHGGGWTGGDPQHQARDLYHALALDGWVVLAIRYPFAPAATVEAQIATVHAAVRWARTGLAGYGTAATSVALAGGSAGGHLAAMAALTAPHGDAVAACVGVYGVYDLANRNRTRAHWGMIASDVVRQTVAEAPQRYRALSPIDNVHDGSPPMLLVHGTRDTLVPVAEARQFASVLREAGRPVDLVEVDGAEHAFDALGAIRSRTTAAVIRDWLGAVVRP
jgi:acetyl esterase/lipase